jgi:TPR repeat protein
MKTTFRRMQANLAVLAALLVLPGAGFAEGLREMKRAAECGDAATQCKLARTYEEGDGVAQNYAKALKWYRAAAEQNFAQAEYRLGRMYAAGKGVSPSYAEEMKWVRRAAAQHHPMAQNRLGVMYERGEGVGQDLAEAYKWFTLAMRTNQNAFAMANRNALLDKLTFEEVAEGERRAGIMIARVQP